MPYDIVSAPGGFYVVGPSGRKSKMPLSRTTAKKQRAALYAAEGRRTGRSVSPSIIPMAVSEFKSEHKRLVKTLKQGSKAKRIAEAARQEAELRERLG